MTAIVHTRFVFACSFLYSRAIPLLVTCIPVFCLALYDLYARAQREECVRACVCVCVCRCGGGGGGSAACSACTIRILTRSCFVEITQSNDSDQNYSTSNHCPDTRLNLSRTLTKTSQCIFKYLRTQFDCFCCGQC